MGARGWWWALGAVSLMLGSLARQQRRERERARPRAKPQPLQTWEGEGGAVPVRGESRTAQRVAPRPGLEV